MRCSRVHRGNDSRVSRDHRNLLSMRALAQVAKACAMHCGIA